MKIKHMESLQTNTLSTDIEERAIALCTEARKLEEVGKYQDARGVLSQFWQRIGDRPKLEGLGGAVRAELLLRVGTLSGWLGSAGQLPGAQEIAKDLISESSALFERLQLKEKVAEAHVDLGICYWREGSLDEARITFDAALQHLGDLESTQRLRALLNKAMVEEVSSRSIEALRILSESEPLFELSASAALKGKFHNEFGTVLKNIGLAQRREDYIDRALMQYTAASVELEHAGNERVVAQVENNLGFLFAHLGKFQEAHSHLDRALSMADDLKDKGLSAEFQDTRASAFLGQGLLDQAANVSLAAVKRFREGDAQSHLAASLTTYGTVIARQGRHPDALLALDEAATISSQVGDSEKAGLAYLTIIEELSSILPRAELRDYYHKAETALSHAQQTAIRFRLGECARTLLANEVSTPTTVSGPATLESTSNGSLEEQVLRYEGDLIRRALEASDGSVTRAARLLGVTHQGLAFILNGRQKSLLASRRPAKKRRRSIIRYH
jgi:tetratricopeptide (TPR) repeat protein